MLTSGECVKNFKFSIVVAIYNSAEYLEETIASVLKQTIGFEKNVQLILVNDGSTDNSMDIIKEYYERYPNNIVPLSKENGGPASARNLGLEYVTGEIVNFLDGDDMLKSNALSRVYKFFKKHDDVDIVAIPLKCFGRLEGDHHLNYKFKKERVVDLKEEYCYPQLSSSSSFIKMEAVSNHSFNETVINGEDLVFINEILLEKQKIGFLNSTEYKYRKRFDSSSYMDNPFSSKKAYTEKMELCYKHLIDYSIRKYTYVPKFIQYLIALDLNGLVNSDEFEKTLTSDDEIAEFWDCLNYILKYIDDDIIKSHKYLKIQFKRFYMYLKHRDVDIQSTRRRAFFKSNGYLIDRVEWHRLFLDIVEIRNNVLSISGYVISNFYLDSLKIEAIIKTGNGEREILECKKVQYPTSERKTRRYLGIDWEFFNNFDLEIPLEKYDDFKVSFRFVFDEDDHHAVSYPQIAFKEYAGLSEYSNYFVNGSKMVLFKDNSLHVIDYSSKFKAKMELKSMLKILFSFNLNELEALFIRLIYFIFYRSNNNKRIWLFMDRPDMADDNAEYLFKYAINQDDGIEKYFILDKRCDDYKRMTRISKNIVNYRSVKHKVLYLFAEKVVSSHVDTFWLNPFYDSNRKFYSGLNHVETCFLQHGVTKDDVSYWIKKFHMNLYLFLTTSDYEKDSILNGHYNFSDDIVKTLGLPRYDNLKNDLTKNEILFFPTWRNYLLDEETFVNSEYYKSLNSFLNNRELLDSLNEKGYKIIFKPHYNLLPFIDLIDVPSEISISEDSFQELFNHSSLLVTDYSSVFFDFAYLKKPIIYYHGDEYHYEQGYFDYETMGFGDITYSEDELVEMIKKIIGDECVMEDKFKNRVDKFFKYNDKDNCKRVYDWLKENK